MENLDILIPQPKEPDQPTTARPIISRKIIIVLIIVSIFSLAYSGIYFSLNSKLDKIMKTKKTSPTPAACTLEAMQCPDGSYVSKTGPNCEFALCPTLKPNPTIGPKQGILSGKLSIGPLCPISPCSDTQNPYLGRTIILKPKTGSSIFVDIKTDGSFLKELNPGTYSLDLNKCEHLGCGEELPKTITIETNKTTQINIDIDTGIR